MWLQQHQLESGVMVAFDSENTSSCGGGSAAAASSLRIAVKQFDSVVITISTFQRADAISFRRWSSAPADRCSRRLSVGHR